MHAREIRSENFVLGADFESGAAIMSAYAQTFSPERLPPDRQDSRRWNVPGFAVPGEAARSDTRSVPREAARLDNRSATVARAVGRDHNVAPLEAEFLGHGRPKRVERSVRYAGERPSALSFIFQFRSIVFRFHGSVLPCILIEVCISVGLSFAALYYTPDETFTTGMHGVVGMLLAFLIGIRTQIAWGEYSAGAGHVGGIICAARGITAEALGALIVSRETRQAGSLPAEATELARLLKLYYYCCVEHLRSSDGHEAWEYSHRVAHSFASSAEVAFFDGEFGKPQPGIERRMVQPSTTTPVPLTWDAPGALKRWDSKWDLRDTLEGCARRRPTPHAASPPWTMARSDQCRLTAVHCGCACALQAREAEHHAGHRATRQPLAPLGAVYAREVVHARQRALLPA